MPNRLAEQTSPYLLQHKDNPVAWEPWDERALARALGEANVNIELAYTTFGGIKLVIATDDMDSARAALDAA